jgi:hypothetical protein
MATTKKAATTKVQKVAVQHLGKGVEVSQDGKFMVIRIDTTQNFGKSHNGEGKNTVIATVGAPQAVNFVGPNGKQIEGRLGLTLFTNQI